MRASSHTLRRTVCDALHAARHALGIRRVRDFERLRTAIVLLLNDEQTHNYVRKLQLDILSRVGINEGLAAEPHITLKLGFKTSRLDDLSKYLDELAGTIEPVQVHLNGFGKFDVEGGYIFLEVAATNQLDELRRRICSDLLDKFGIEPHTIEGDQFHFHVTVAHGLPEASFAAEYRMLFNQPLELRSLQHTLALLCWVGNHWITYKQVRINTLSKVPAD